MPPLGFVLLLNFIEHFVALPDLLILFPVLLALLGWLILSAKFSREGMLLPAVVFLAVFAFAYGIRCLQPTILPTSDGLSDLNKINNYSQGDTLPPIDTWLPPFHYVWYYSLQHYAASIVKRLFDVPLGVAYNSSHALLSAFTCVAGAAAAYRLSGGKTWITLATVVVIESAATGSTAYIQLFMHQPSMWYANNLSGGVLDYDHGRVSNWLWQWLAHDPFRERLELQPPGFWTWRDEYHANASGHLLTLLAVFVIAELTALRNSTWPWILAVVIPVLAVDASTWAYPINLLLCGGAVGLAWWCGRRPASLPVGGMILLGALILIWPSLYDVTSSPEAPDIIRTKMEWLAPWREFLVQWWPIILLWGYGCFIFRELSFGLRWILVVIPMMLIGVELITVEGRYNTVEKMWGYTYGTGMIALFPIVAARSRLDELVKIAWTLPLAKKSRAAGAALISRPSIFARFLTLILLFSAVVSLFSWIDYKFQWVPWDAFGHLEGNHYLTSDNQKKRMLQVVTQVKRKTFLSGKSDWCYYEAPALTVFTGNRSYIAWYYFESVADYAEEAVYRNKLNNDFYSGAMADPLTFLRSNDITGVLIWPEDNIPDAYLAKLKTELAPDYRYVDCRDNGWSNAGVFLRTPISDHAAAAPVNPPQP